MKKLLMLSLMMSFVVLAPSHSSWASSLSSSLKGRILLQVESKGEAWYVSPANEKRYSMGRPNDAFNLMRELGIGISNDNLEKIQIANENLTGEDSDDDGLSDATEDSIGTNKDNQDSDNDGYDDQSELRSGYNPNGPGKILIDSSFAKKQAGKIFLQVESKGEAWYVNPVDNKRYFLGRPADAFNLMRKLGLGISDNNLNKITENQGSNQAQNEQSDNVVDARNCNLLPAKLDSCTPYKCQVSGLGEFIGGFTGQDEQGGMTFEVVGFVDGKCQLIQEMPPYGKVFECNFATEAIRKAVAQYYQDTIVDGKIYSVEATAGPEGAIVKYFYNGEEVYNALQEAMDTKQCVMPYTNQ